MLKDARLSEGSFLGTFELSNVRLDSKLILDGKRETGTFWPTDPSIAVQLSQEVANRSASDFRIVLTPSQPAICIISRPFHAVPERSPVTGFESGSSTGWIRRVAYQCPDSSPLGALETRLRALSRRLDVSYE